MKAGIHPEYREVVFQDVTSDFRFLTRSTLSSKESVKWQDGNEYPLIKIDISSASHPFYTGQNKIMDTSGRIDKFRSATPRSKRACGNACSGRHWRPFAFAGSGRLLESVRGPVIAASSQSHRSNWPMR